VVTKGNADENVWKRQFGQALARQKYWEISLRVVEPKIPALCNFKTSKNYKKAR
jgi:hypothetical protein